MDDKLGWIPRATRSELCRYGLARLFFDFNLKLPLGFFTYHDRLEEQHAQHTKEELQDYYMKTPSMNEDQFILHGKEMLDAVAVFWEGLDQQRKDI